jgi:hypothetical protein
MSAELVKFLILASKESIKPLALCLKNRDKPGV